MKTKLQVWRTLSQEDRSNLFRAWMYLLIAGTAVRALPVPQVEALLERLARVSPRKEVPPARLARLVDIAARRHLRPMTCLPRSLALRALLQSHGIEADLRIGVRLESGRLRAHAWIEEAGDPVGEAREVGLFFPPLIRPQSTS